MPQPRAFAPDPAQPRVQEPVRKLVPEDVQENVKEELQGDVNVQLHVPMQEDTLGVHERNVSQSSVSAAAPPACPVEDITRAYLLTSAGDADIALRCVIADALTDLLEAESRARARSRLISRGYVRGQSVG